MKWRKKGECLESVLKCLIIPAVKNKSFLILKDR